MNRTKQTHTPGPWEVSDTGGNIYGATGDVVASVHGFPKPFLTGEGGANARLIAEAPQMLDAIRALVKDLEMWPGDKNPEFFTSLKNARAILARIEGGGDS